MDPAGIVASLIGLVFVGILGGWTYKNSQESRRVELIGKRHSPHPIKTTSSVAEALKIIEKSLAQRSSRDHLWTIADSNAETGLFVASAYTYTSLNPRASIGIDNDVYLEAQLLPDPEGGGTIVRWQYSIKGKNNALIAPTSSAGETANTRKLIDETNDRIRSTFGF